MVRPPPTSTRTAPRFPHATLFRSVSQPALTRTIKRAEAVLGIERFARSTRRVALTAAGREFVPLAERFLSDLDIGIRNMRELGGRQRGQIVVACLMSVAYSVLPPVIRAYRERYPGIQLQLRENVQGVLQEEVRAGIADFGIGDVAAPHPSLI